MNTCGNGTSPARKESTRARSRDICATRGAMKACLTTEEISAGRSDANSHQRRGRDRDGLRPRSLNQKNLSLGPGGQTQRAMVDPKIAGRTGSRALPPTRFRIAAYDYGIKENILRLLRQKGFEVTVVPAGTRLKKCWLSIPTEFFFLTVQVIPRHSLMHTKLYTI